MGKIKIGSTRGLTGESLSGIILYAPDKVKSIRGVEIWSRGVVA